MPDLMQIIRSSVIDTLSFLHFATQRVRAYVPPALDDFDNSQRISWEAFIGQERWGGYMRLPKDVMPSEKMLRRGIAFALLVQDHPGRAWLHDTLEAFQAHGPLPELHGQTNPEWTLGPERLVLSHLQALALRQMEQASQGYETIAEIQGQFSGVQLESAALAALELPKLAQLALARRIRQIEAESPLPKDS